MKTKKQCCNCKRKFSKLIGLKGEDFCRRCFNKVNPILPVEIKESFGISLRLTRPEINTWKSLCKKFKMSSSKVVTLFILDSIKKEDLWEKYIKKME